MKKVIIPLVAIILVVGIAVGGIFFYQHSVAKAKLEALEREALMERRIQEIISSNEAEKQSLLDRIDELMAEEVVVFDAAPIQEQILAIGELATEKYAYTNVGTLDGDKYFSFVNLKIPFSHKGVVVSMDGVVKAGIDVTKVKIDADEETKTIIVTIPEATILSNTPDEDTFMVHVEDDPLFNNITLKDSSTVRAEIQATAEARAIELGILEDARTRAGEIVRNLIEAVPSVKDTYTIVIR